MSEKIEGTLVLDGMMEGVPAGLEDLRDELQRWVDRARELKFPFHLEIDGASFNLLADPNAIEITELSEEPAEAVSVALNAFLEIFPPEQRVVILSTIRSMEYRKGEEIQTVYAVGPDGTIHTRQRIVDADTATPIQPLTRREKIRLGIIGLVILAAGVGVSVFFVDYPAFFQNVIEKLTPLDPDAIDVRAERFADYFSIKEKAKGPGSQSIVLTLQRTETFPKTDEEVNQLAEKIKDDFVAGETLKAIHRGYLRFELFNKDDEMVKSCERRIADLREKETVEVDLPLGSKGRPVRIVIRP